MECLDHEELREKNHYANIITRKTRLSVEFLGMAKANKGKITSESNKYRTYTFLEANLTLRQTLHSRDFNFCSRRGKKMKIKDAKRN